MPPENENENEDLTPAAAGDTTPNTPEAPAEGDEPQAEEPEVDLSDEEGSAAEGDETEESDSESEDEPAAEQAPVQGKSEDQDDWRKEIASLREERRVMLDLLKERQQPPAPPPPDPNADVPDEVLRMALFGDSTGQWKTVPQDIQAKALRLAQEHVSREIRAARSPKVLKDEIQQAVFEQVAPLVEDYHSRKARELTERHLAPLKDPAMEARAKELFKTMPGANSANWRDIEKALEAAATKARAEVLEKRFREQDNKTKAGKVQKTGNGGTKLKPTGKPGTPAKVVSKDSRPPMKPGERLTDYFDRIKSYLQ